MLRWYWSARAASTVPWNESRTLAASTVPWSESCTYLERVLSRVSVSRPRFCYHIDGSLTFTRSRICRRSDLKKSVVTGAHQHCRSSFVEGHERYIVKAYALPESNPTPLSINHQKSRSADPPNVSLPHVACLLFTTKCDNHAACGLSSRRTWLTFYVQTNAVVQPHVASLFTNVQTRVNCSFTEQWLQVPYTENLPQLLTRRCAFGQWISYHKFFCQSIGHC